MSTIAASRSVIAPTFRDRNFAVRLRAGQIPELAEVTSLQHFREKGLHHDGDVLTHSLEALERAKRFTSDLRFIPDARVRQWAAHDLNRSLTPFMPHTRAELVWLAALLHDVGKGATVGGQPVLQERADGTTFAHGHAAIGAEKAREIALRLGLPHTEAAYIHMLVAYHMHTYQRGEPSSLETLFKKVDFDIGFVFLKLADLDPNFFAVDSPRLLDMFIYRYTVPAVHQRNEAFILTDLRRLLQRRHKVIVVFEDGDSGRFVERLKAKCAERVDRLRVNFVRRAVGQLLADEPPVPTESEIAARIREALVDNIDRTLAPILRRVAVAPTWMGEDFNRGYNFDLFPQERPVLYYPFANLGGQGLGQPV